MHFSSLHSWFQALTRVSISRNSRGEMIHIFLSRAGELCFHFSFSSSFSRFLDTKISCSSRFVRFSKQFSFSSRFSRLWRKSSLSTLDLWDSVHCFSKEKQWRVEREFFLHNLENREEKENCFKNLTNREE